MNRHLHRVPLLKPLGLLRAAQGVPPILELPVCRPPGGQRAVRAEAQLAPRLRALARALGLRKRALAFGAEKRVGHHVSLARRR